MASSDSSAPSRTKALTVFLATVALVVYPPLYAVFRSGDRGFLAYVRGDALLYLSIARNSVGGFFTFDGTTATNGFHPLWQYFLAAVVAHSEPAASMAPVRVAFFSSVVAVAIGAGLSALAIYKCTRSRLLSMLVVPGVYYLVIGSMFDNEPIWGSVGGMESGFSALFGGLLLFIIAHHVAVPDRRFDDLYASHGLKSPFVQIGLVAPFVVLSRLDDIMLLPPLLAVCVFLPTDRSWRDRLKAAAWLAAPTTIMVLLYMAFNKSYAGTFLPISGKTKGGFVLAQSLYVALAEYVPPVLDLKNAISSKASDPVSFYYSAHRAMQLLAPAVISGLYILWAWAARRGQVRFMLPMGLAGFVLLKAGYNLAYVNLWHQGGWYFTFIFLTVSFLVANALQPLAERLAREPVLRRGIPVLYGVYVLVASGRQAAFSADIVGQVEHDYFQATPAIAKALTSSQRDVKLLAFDDGVTGYALPFPTIHGFGFAADVDTFHALQEHRLLRHAYDRGHTILTSGVYMPLNVPLQTSDAVRNFLQASFLEQSVKDELKDFDFRLVYVDEKTGAPFIELIPRKG